MILVFGGTTEGRKAAETLEEAGTPYYYSTRSDMQQMEMVNGIRLSGEKDGAAMTDFCQCHDIRLIVDAAHPFAESLHRHLLQTAQHLGLPVIRYDRIYPPRRSDIIWCDHYQDAIHRMEANGVERLLALTGVNTLLPLRDYWQRHECWFRILRRRDSLQKAHEAHFPQDHLLYYEDDDTASMITRCHPDAILTKESGESGGFEEKVTAARQTGLLVFAVKRPPYPPQEMSGLTIPIVCVNGPYGLRRAVEKMLPAFYPLHSGLTTGTCATAAAIADAQRLFHGQTPDEVPVVLPNGETIRVVVGYGDGYAYVVKESGDDPDVTDGLEIRASVRNLSDSSNEDIQIMGGEGVGTYTLPGFDYPPGEPAINKVPRQMIRENLKKIGHPLRVMISVPDGDEIARRTFNPRLGIVGGISIIGVSGIVKPFSEQAFIDSIRKCLEVAKSSGAERVVINSGAKSERFVRSRYPNLPRQAFVEYGNYIGETLRMAEELDIAQVTMGVMLGKAVKLAAGQLDTHSRRGTMDKQFIAQMLSEAKCEIDITDLSLARDLWKMIPADRIPLFCRVVIDHCRRACIPLLTHTRLTILLIGEEGEVYE